MVVLQVSSTDVALSFIELPNRCNPITLAIRVIVTSGAVQRAKFRRAEFVWAEAVFLHVGLPVNAVNAEMRTAYDAQSFAADTAGDEVDSFILI